MVIAAHPTTAAPVSVAGIIAALDEIGDPEIPSVSIVELGMIGRVDLGASSIHVELLPTFVGCPALDMIRVSIADRLTEFGLPVEVAVSFSPPWSTERISPEGREKLRRAGFAPPPFATPDRAPFPGGDRGTRALPVLEMLAIREPVACPFCGSERTSLENAFGPTPCRSIRHCAECRQPFEAFKAV